VASAVADMAPRGWPVPTPLAETRPADGRQRGRRACLHGVPAAAQPTNETLQRPPKAAW